MIIDELLNLYTQSWNFPVPFADCMTRLDSQRAKLEGFKGDYAAKLSERISVKLTISAINHT